MRGGKRQGSGRKKGIATLISERVRSYVAERVEKEQEPLINAQIKKANKGDTFAFNALMDRAFGRPVQGLEHTGKDGKDLPQPILGYISKNGVSINDGDTETSESEE